MTMVRDASIARPTTVDRGRTRSGAGRRVAIVGGGASGVLTALQLLETGDPLLQVTVHEASGVLGRGVAYSTSDDRHLLNVRARHMSAFADVPDDLIDWAVETGRDPDPLGFLSRADYAHYLQDRLARVADHRLSIHAGRVTALHSAGGCWELVSHDRVSVADTVVLALGNSAPAGLRSGHGVVPDAPWHLPDPWDLPSLRRLPDDAVVVLVGSGLTAIDAAITLLEDAPAREVVMLSRGGRLPEPHIARQHTAWVTPVPTGPLTADGLAELVSGQIAAAERRGVDWRSVVDGLRPATQDLWRRLPTGERRAFLERHRRAWEVRRHRMAPEVAARIGAYRAQGRLRVVDGGLCAVEEVAGEGGGSRCLVTGRDLTITADALVNCTGPQTDVTRSQDPLVRHLLAHGRLSPDELRLGLSTTWTGEALGADGDVVPDLFVVGPARRATLWESTAVPEIRQQAAQVAAQVAARVAAQV